MGWRKRLSSWRVLLIAAGIVAVALVLFILLLWILLPKEPGVDTINGFLNAGWLMLGIVFVGLPLLALASGIFLLRRRNRRLSSTAQHSRD